ncbi:MAG TPA: hypothetical protein VES68_02580 [Candidatus Sulfotelmatobacter sp.]|nr:hypothetical protein [Candidatus Sulfotelmatobacter sp.]
MKKWSKVIGILILIVVILATVKIYISNGVATSGIVLEKVEQEEDAYRLENSLLSEKLYTDSSLTHINEKAELLGYADKRSDYVISSQQSVALKQ